MDNDFKKELSRTIKFTLFSISAGIIQTLVFTLLNELCSFNYWISYLTSLIISIICNFTLNRNITFKSASNVPIAMLKVFAYYAIFTPFSTILGDYLVESVNVNEYLVFALTLLANFITEYLYDRFYVFRKSLDTKILEKN